MLVRIVSLLAIHKPLEIINFVSSDGLFNWILMLPFYFIYLFIYFYYYCYHYDYHIYTLSAVIHPIHPANHKLVRQVRDGHTSHAHDRKKMKQNINSTIQHHKVILNPLTSNIQYCGPFVFAGDIGSNASVISGISNRCVRYPQRIIVHHFYSVILHYRMSVLHVFSMLVPRDVRLRNSCCYALDPN